MELEVEVAHVHLHCFWPQQTLQRHEDGFAAKRERQLQASGFFLPISSFLNWYPLANHTERWGFLNVFSQLQIWKGLPVSYPCTCEVYLELSRNEERETSFSCCAFALLFSTKSKASKKNISV